MALISIIYKKLLLIKTQQKYGQMIQGVNPKKEKMEAQMTNKYKMNARNH
jgi:hypothetical protein